MKTISQIKTMDNCNKTKDKEQKKALNLWAANKFNGSIIAGTGFGKTRVGVLATAKILEYYPNDKALVLVPTTQLQDQFEDEFLKWGYTDVLDRVDILCYQSAYKLKGRKYRLVIGDEIHLGLSPQDLEYKAKLQKLAPIVYRLKLDDCVKLGLVSPYEIFCMPVDLTEEEEKEYKKANNMFVHYKYKLGQFDAFNEAKRIIGSNNVTALEKQHAVMFYKAMRQRKSIVDFAENKIYGVRNILIKLGQFDAFNEAKRILADNSSGSHEKQWAIMFYKSIRSRKAVVDFASNKIEALKTLVLQNPSNKILTFAGANEFTDKMCDALSPLALSYHSKKTKKQKKEALEYFKDGKINVLCSTKALNQGFDMPDADMGIICGLTSKSLTMIQRVGRLLRFQENKIGKIVILYVQNTQEEKWLKSAVKGLTNVNWVDLITEE